MINISSNRIPAVPATALAVPAMAAAILSFFLVICLPGTALAQATLAPDELWEVYEPYVIENGGGRDAIKPLLNPEFIPVTDAALVLDRHEVVFVTKGPGGIEIYPQKILARHEVVNMSTNQDRRVITYCPFTGSVVVYKGTLGAYRIILGGMGMFLNSNRLLFDHATNSLWVQLTGQSIQGPLAGQRLKSLPVLWTTWEAASREYPEARVLNRPRKYRFRYNEDPIGSYERTGTYYDSGPPANGLMHRDERLEPKVRVLGLNGGGSALAIVASGAQSKKVLNVDNWIQPVAVFYDNKMKAVRAFEPRVARINLTFNVIQGEIVDNETKSKWSPKGVAVEGRLRGFAMKRLMTIDSMWFAWAAFHPNTVISR